MSSANCCYVSAKISMNSINSKLLMRKIKLLGVRRNNLMLCLVYLMCNVFHECFMLGSLKMTHFPLNLCFHQSLDVMVLLTLKSIFYISNQVSRILSDGFESTFDILMTLLSLYYPYVVIIVITTLANLYNDSNNISLIL